MSAVAIDDVPRGTPDTFGGLVRDGETPEEALRRLEKRRDYTKIIGTDDGQRLLEAATAQVRERPNGGRGRARPTTRLQAAAHESEPVAPLAQRVEQIPLESIDIGTNVRVNVAELDELTASIQEHGVLQPIKVRPAGDRFTIVWGQRRFIAARQAGLATIPALVDVADKTTSTLAIEQLVENLHRADLPPLDRARAMRAVVDAGMSQADLAKELGIAPSTVTNDLGLLEAPAAIQTSIEAGRLTPSHAKALKGLASKTQQELAKESIERGYSAHRLEEEVQRRKRIAENEAKRDREAAEQSQKNVEELRSSIAELATKKKPGLDTEIIVFQDYYGQGDVKIKTLAAALTKAGFTKIRVASRGDDVAPRPKGCDCSAWKATLKSSYSYSSGGWTTKLQATPACIVSKHRQDKATADRKAEQAKYALQGRVQDHVTQTAAAWAVPAARAIAVDRILAEAILWDALSYQLPEWAAARGGKRNQPWAVLHALTDEELAAELRKRIAGDFRDKAGYHVDWTELAGEFGLVEPEEPATGKKAAARPAITADDRIGELVCQGSNHVPGHTPDCPQYVVS